MVGLQQVDQLVGDHVLNDARRELEGAPVDVDRARPAARSPAEAEIADGDGRRGDADAVGQQVDAATEPRRAVGDVPGNQVLGSSVTLWLDRRMPAPRTGSRVG